MRIAQESIFSGLNNLTVNSAMDEAYDRYFGFTNEEVSKMLEYYGVAEKRVNFKNGMMDICLEMKKSIIRGLLLIIFRRGVFHRHIG